MSLGACGSDPGGVSSGASESGTTEQTSGDTTTDPTPTTSDGDAGTATDVTEGGMTAGQTDTGVTTEETETAAVSVTSADPVCGNELQEEGEACDDGNAEPGDGCEPDCTLTPSVCGNEIVEFGEACDDGNTEDGDECSADCQTPTPTQECGNGMVEEPEACDDGNQDPGDGCEPDCTYTPAECGNGKKEGDEECDDGNDVDGGANDFCKNDCTAFSPAQCQAPPKADYINCDDAIALGDKNDKTNALRAMGICNDAANNSILVSDFQFESNNNAAWQVARGFGTYKFDHDMNPATETQLLYSPREGSTFLMISTGVIAAPNAQGLVTELPNSQVFNNENQNNDTNQLPPPFQTKRGSNNGAGGTPFIGCDGVNDCSDTLQAQWTLGNSDPNDRLWFTFKTTVPEGTFGYTFDFVFCSAEWPDYVGDPWNDLLITYQVDPTPDNPNAEPPVDAYTGNVTFIPDPNDNTKGLPLTITALDPYYDGPGYTYLEPQLAGTGFEQHACSDWFTAKGGVQPGAEVTIGFFLADMADANLATVALLDNFRWDCEGCIPSEVDDCGIQPM